MIKKFWQYSKGVNGVLFALLVLGLGLKSQLGFVWSDYLITLSLYGLSGTITNVVAIVMIFEKIPYVYGSGIIEDNFDLFKLKLKDVLMSYLFSQGPSIGNINYESLSEKLFEKFKTTSLGLMFQWISVDQIAVLLKEIDLESLIGQEVSTQDWELYLTNQINRLNPQQIKELILRILEDHLQWLVVWGAVLGVLIGVVDILLR